jgi:hypothetical protein
MESGDIARMATERGGIESPGGAIGSDAATPEPNLEFPITSGDETLVQDENPRKNNTVLLSDWSQTGRGSHVEFSYDEKVPIEQGEPVNLSESDPLTARLKAIFLVEVLWEMFMRLQYKDGNLPIRKW